MKRYLLLAAALCTTGLLSAGARVGAAAGVSFTLVTSAINNPIGIDWLPAGPFKDQLVVSYNYGDGIPNNFAHVDRTTGAAAPWGGQSGWNDEIYFATARPGQDQGGWTVGQMFSAQGNLDDGPPGFLGTGNVQAIAQFDADGVLLNPSFAILPGETKLKRGGVTFDRFGVAGYDLIVVASNDYFGGAITGPSDVYRINALGLVTHVGTYDMHLEGVTTIPNDVAMYGPWAGKILAAAEKDGLLVAIDPVSGAFQTFNAAAFGLPEIEGEDLWVIPAQHTFYGVEIGDVAQENRIWKVDAAQWTNYVGQVLVAQEYYGQLTAIRWNGSGFVATTLYDGSAATGSATPAHWEHITFAPNAALGDFVWHDVNKNGLQDAGEPGIGGVSVQLYACGGVLVATTTTNASGYYAFTNLQPGCYYLVFSTPMGYVPTAALVGSNIDIDSDAQPNGVTLDVTLSGGEFNRSIDAGFKLAEAQPFKTFTIGGWGSRPHGNNPGALLANNFASVYPFGLVVGGNYTLKLTSALAVRSYLPDGGTPAVLSQNYLNATTTSAKTFGSQVTGLKLNVDFSNAGIITTGLASLKIAAGYPLAGQTVAQVLASAQVALGGGALPAGITSIAQFNQLITALNENFDNGTTNKGVLVP